MKVIEDSKEKSRDRHALAIPKQDGLLMTRAIPLASRETAFTVYKAMVVPLPQSDDDMTIKWNVEAEYLAVLENLMETSLVTRDQLDKYLGSSNYRICHETLATVIKDSSCLATFYIGNILDALEEFVIQSQSHYH